MIPAGSQDGWGWKGPWRLQPSAQARTPTAGCPGPRILIFLSTSVLLCSHLFKVILHFSTWKIIHLFIYLLSLEDFLWTQFTSVTKVWPTKWLVKGTNMIQGNENKTFNTTVSNSKHTMAQCWNETIQTSICIFIKKAVSLLKALLRWTTAWNFFPPLQ